VRDLAQSDGTGCHASADNFATIEIGTYLFPTQNICHKAGRITRLLDSKDLCRRRFTIEEPQQLRNLEG
jgi:hypothetical protein